MNKKIKVRIVNSSLSEAFKFADIEIGRGHDETVTMPIEKAHKLVAELSSIASISVSFVSESNEGDLNALDSALLEVQTLKAQSADVEALNAQVASLEALLAAEREKVASLEALLAKANKAPAESNVSLKDAPAQEPVVNTAAKKVTK
jgi:hypothetical protein